MNPADFNPMEIDEDFVYFQAMQKDVILDVKCDYHNGEFRSMTVTKAETGKEVWVDTCEEATLRRYSESLYREEIDLRPHREEVENEHNAFWMNMWGWTLILGGIWLLQHTALAYCVLVPLALVFYHYRNVK